MIVGNTDISREDFPSFLKPNQIPYYMYQSMQDTLKANLPQAMQVQQAQPINNTETNPSMWNNKGDK